MPKIEGKEFNHITCEECEQTFAVVYFKGQHLCRECLNPEMTEEEKEATRKFYQTRQKSGPVYPKTPIERGEIVEMRDKIHRKFRKEGWLIEDYVKRWKREPKYARGECTLCAIESICGKETNSKEDGTCESFIRKETEE